MIDLRINQAFQGKTSMNSATTSLSLFVSVCLTFSIQQAKSATLLTDPSQVNDSTTIDFDTPDSDSIGELLALGVSINSLDNTADPFISNVGGPGIGTLTSNAFGNTRNGQFAVIDPGFEGSSVRDFEIVFVPSVLAAGYAVQGWSTRPHELSAISNTGEVITAISFADALVADDTGPNGFIGIDGEGTPIRRLVFTDVGNPDSAPGFVAFDNLTFAVVPEPSTSLIAAFGFLLCLNRWLLRL